jgi:hypothetical protein
MQTKIQALPTEDFDIVVVGDYPLQAPELFHSLGLSQMLEGRGEMLERRGISTYLPQPRTSIVAALAKPPRPTLYRKNGILVGHSGRRITPEDVANALNEE